MGKRKPAAAALPPQKKPKAEVVPAEAEAAELEVAGASKKKDQAPKRPEPAPVKKKKKFMRERKANVEPEKRDAGAGAALPKQSRASKATQDGFKVLVKGLAYKVDEAKLLAEFGHHGPVLEAKLLRDDAGYSRGTAFVTFGTAAALASACKRKDFAGRAVFVQAAQAKQKGKGRGQSPAEQPAGCTTVVVKQLSKAVTEDDVWECFEDCAPTRVQLLADRDTGESKCVAFVDLSDAADVAKAKAKDRTTIKGSSVTVDFVAPKDKGKAKGKGAGDEDAGKGQSGPSRPAASAEARANRGAVVAFQGAVKTFDDDSE